MTWSMDLKEFEATLQNCQRCCLAAHRQHLVFARGNAHAHIMMVGEGPGGDEDRLGQPFVGKAGQLLDRIIAGMKLPTDDIYICNVVKCRPPNNRLPQPEEVAVCKGFLRHQIRVVHPQIIVCLGALATQVIVDPQAKITRDRGKWVQKGSFMIMPTFHPAALLRDESKKILVYHDMQLVAAEYQKQGGTLLPVADKVGSEHD